MAIEVFHLYTVRGLTRAFRDHFPTAFARFEGLDPELLVMGIDRDLLTRKLIES